MKKQINEQEFINEFKAHGRLDQIGGREGARLLFEYLEELEREAGCEIELDVVAICCDYHHYDTKEEAIEDGYSEEDIVCMNDYACFVM